MYKITLSFAFCRQYITTKTYQVCMKELDTPHGYDPVTVTSLIVGMCFITVRRSLDDFALFCLFVNK